MPSNIKKSTSAGSGGKVVHMDGTTWAGSDAQTAMVGGGNGGGGRMEGRINKLEARVEHIQTDITDVRDDIRDIRNWGFGLFIVLCGVFFGVGMYIDTKIEGIDEKANATALSTSVISSKIDVLTSMLTGAANGNKQLLENQHNTEPKDK